MRFAHADAGVLQATIEAFCLSIWSLSERQLHGWPSECRFGLWGTLRVGNVEGQQAWRMQQNAKTLGYTTN